MKRTLMVASAVAALAMITSCVLPYKAQEREEKKTITVHGKGVVTRRADMAQITFSVVTQEWIAKTATESNAVITSRVYDAIKGAGVSAADIDTEDISLYRQDTYANGRSFPGRYRVSNNINVKIRDVTKASAIIDVAVAAGATEMSALSFGIGDTSSLLREARTKAIQDAGESAALLAGASGCKIGDAIMINEDNGGSGQGVYSSKNIAFDAAAPTPISVREVQVTSNVTVTYLLQ